MSIAAACSDWANSDAEMLTKISAEKKSTDCLDKLLRNNYFDSAKEFVNLKYVDSIPEAQTISR